MCSGMNGVKRTHKWGEGREKNKRFLLKFGFLRTIQIDLIKILSDFPENIHFSTE